MTKYFTITMPDLQHIYPNITNVRIFSVSSHVIKQYNVIYDNEAVKLQLNHQTENPDGQSALFTLLTGLNTKYVLLILFVFLTVEMVG